MGTTLLELCGRPPTGGRCCAQVAFQQADYVAWNLWAAINRRPLLRFQYQHLGDMMSLGRRDGAVALPFAPPAPLAAALQRSPLLPLLSAAGIRRAAPAGRRAAL
jgi:NADH:ubiquinone reductase (non-electrogenic)